MGKDSYHHGNTATAARGAAMAMLRTGGEQAVSLRGVARAIGVDPAALYRHFASKDALMGAIAQAGFAQLATRMEQAGGASAHDRMIAIGVSYIQFALEEPHLFDVMFRLWASDGISGQADSGRTAGDILYDCWADLSGQQAPPSVIWAAVHGAAMLARGGLKDQLKTRPAQEALCRAAIAGALAKS